MNTEQEKLIADGDEAAALLATSAFTSVINELVDQAFSSFVNSEPHEAEKREQSFHHYRAVIDVVNTLNQRVMIRDQIMAKTDET